jgi:hypothetical protein
MALAGCGGDDVASGPPVVTGEGLGDSLALAAKRDLEDRSIFSSHVGEHGGTCKGLRERWECELDIVVTSSGTLRDRRTYVLSVKDDGCWVARQTGTDVGQSGIPRRPRNPQVLRGCVE